MKKNEFKKKIDAAESKKKVDEGYIPARINPVIEFLQNTWDFLKTKGLTLVVAAGIAVGGATLTACNNDKQPSEPVDPNPPIVTPIDPDKPGPVDPDPEKPDPDKPGPVDPDPENPTPGGDEKPELTEKQKQELIVQNVYAAVEPKLAKPSALGNNAIVNKVCAVDYYEENDTNYVCLLIDNTTTVQKLDLIAFPLTSEASYDNLLNNQISLSDARPTKILQITEGALKNSDSETSTQIYNKVSNLLESTTEPLITSYSYGGGGSDNVLGAFLNLTFYNIGTKEIEKNLFEVKSDVYETSAINDNLINGTYGETFRLYAPDRVYYKFSDNAIVNYNGLTYEKQTEEVTALTYKVRKVGTYNNGRVYINLDDEQQI